MAARTVSAYITPAMLLEMKQAEMRPKVFRALGMWIVSRKTGSGSEFYHWNRFPTWREAIDYAVGGGK